MIVAVETYLVGKLVAAGIPAKRIAAVAKDHRNRPMPYAEIATEPERLSRDGRKSRRSYDGGSQQATTTVRNFRRELAVGLTLVHRGKAELATLLDAFLAGLDRGIVEPLPAPATGDQFIRIEPQTADWEDDPALLKDRAQLKLRIVFKGGLYSQSTGATIQQINPPTVTMT